VVEDRRASVVGLYIGVDLELQGRMAGLALVIDATVLWYIYRALVAWP
jgi:hypothetical protein